MAKIRIEELEALAGEVLPERTVLGAMPQPPGAPIITVCSPNNQTFTADGNVASLVGGNMQCGLHNTGTASGTGLLDEANG